MKEGWFGTTPGKTKPQGAVTREGFAGGGFHESSRRLGAALSRLNLEMKTSEKPHAAVQTRELSSGRLMCGDVLDALAVLPEAAFQAIIADPPYYQVLVDQEWDQGWASPDAYLEWTIEWVRACRRTLRPDGLLFVFGQHGKREHVWLHVCSRLAIEMQFHDLLVWDRMVGYNERSDSFTPQYEMILVLRQPGCEKPYFNKDAVRVPYDEATIRTYLRDKRYKDMAARETHLRKGRYATNILRVPSLKGISREKCGHPSQKPEALIHALISSSTHPGDSVLDPFLGSGTTAAVARRLDRRWVGIEKNPDYVEMAAQRLDTLI